MMLGGRLRLLIYFVLVALIETEPKQKNLIAKYPTGRANEMNKNSQMSSSREDRHF